MSTATDNLPAAEPLCRTVYGYVLGFEGSPRAVIGVQCGGEWLLPGGPVEGEGVPDCSQASVPADCGDPLRFAQLAFHVRQQTGLELVRVAGPFAVNVHPAQAESFDVSMFYLAIATGAQTGGILLAGDSLPKFSASCPVERAFIRDFLATGNPLPRPSFWKRLAGLLGR
jgi:hypothetical protein